MDEGMVQGLIADLRGQLDQMKATLQVSGEEVLIPTRAGFSRSLVYRPVGAAGASAEDGADASAEGGAGAGAGAESVAGVGSSNGALPVFFDIHGGGFIMGSPELCNDFARRVADELGVVVIAPSYRLAPEHKYPSDKEDVLDVVEYVRAHAEEFGIDPARMAIGGHSAGGNIAASICLQVNKRDDLSFKCAILDYAPLNFSVDSREKEAPAGCLDPNLAHAFDLAYCTPEDGKSMFLSPLLAKEGDLAGLPPHVVVTAEGDTLRSEGEEYARMLMAAGVEVRGRRFKGVTHGFTLMPPDASIAESVEQVVEAAREVQDLMIAGLRDYLSN